MNKKFMMLTMMMFTSWQAMGMHLEVNNVEQINNSSKPQPKALTSSYYRNRAAIIDSVANLSQSKTAKQQTTYFDDGTSQITYNDMTKSIGGKPRTETYNAKGEKIIDINGRQVKPQSQPSTPFLSMQFPKLPTWQRNKVAAKIEMIDMKKSDTAPVVAQPVVEQGRANSEKEDLWDTSNVNDMNTKPSSRSGRLSSAATAAYHAPQQIAAYLYKLLSNLRSPQVRNEFAKTTEEQIVTTNGSISQKDYETLRAGYFKWSSSLRPNMSLSSFTQSFERFVNWGKGLFSKSNKQATNMRNTAIEETTNPMHQDMSSNQSIENVNPTSKTEEQPLLATENSNQTTTATENALQKRDLSLTKKSQTLLETLTQPNNLSTSKATLFPENSAIATNLQYIPGYPGDNGSLKSAGISDRRQEKLPKTKPSVQSAPETAAAPIVQENNPFKTTGELHELLPNYTNFSRDNHSATRVDVSPKTSTSTTNRLGSKFADSLEASSDIIPPSE